MYFHLRWEGEDGLAVGGHRREMSLEQEVHRALPAFHREVATHRAKAMTDCTLAILNRRDVLQFLDRNPVGWPSMVEILCERLRRTTVQISEVALLELPVRLAKALLRLTKFVDHTAEPIKLSQRELGNIVGATRESVNKCMREWQRSETIRIEDNSIMILDRARLEAIADALAD